MRIVTATMVAELVQTAEVVSVAPAPLVDLGSVDGRQDHDLADPLLDALALVAEAIPDLAEARVPAGGWREEHRGYACSWLSLRHIHHGHGDLTAGSSRGSGYDTGAIQMSTIHCQSIGGILLAGVLIDQLPLG